MDQMYSHQFTVKFSTDIHFSEGNIKTISLSSMLRFLSELWLGQDYAIVIKNRSEENEQLFRKHRSKCVSLLQSVRKIEITDGKKF